MDTSIDTAVVTTSEPDDRPWHRRSRLYDREAEIRRMQAEGYSLRQIIDRLGLDVSRPYLWRFLQRAARSAGEPAPAATPAALSGPASAEAAAEDAAALALLNACGFTPPPTSTTRTLK